jgi:hypothetical protein
MVRFHQVLEPAAADLSDEGSAAPGMRLTGVVIAPGTRVAIFSTSDGQLFDMSVGTILYGSKVESITPHEVAVSNENIETVLHPVSQDAVPVRLRDAVCSPCAAMPTMISPQKMLQGYLQAISARSVTRVDAVPVSSFVTAK